jgi:hypothetical protein
LNANEFLYLVNSVRYLRYLPRNAYANRVTSILRWSPVLQALVSNRFFAESRKRTARSL